MPYRLRIWILALIVLALAGCQPGGESPLPTAVPPPMQVPSVPRGTGTWPQETAVSAVATPAPPAPTSLPPRLPVDLASLQLDLEPVVEGLDEPVGLVHAGDGSGRLFVLERKGVVRVVRDGVLQPTPFLDITDRVNTRYVEQGLLGLAFHPRYAENGRLFVNYINFRGDTQLSRFEVGEDPERVNAAAEMPLETEDQPAANHNGGQLAFGPDGYLYIAFGDGGGAGDPHGNAQNLGTFLGSLIRVDVDRMAFAAPSSNPYIGVPGSRPHIWAIGLRNPWRFSFDRATGDLYIGDVGQDRYEEINFQPAGSGGGQNYGWPVMEGMHCYQDRSCDPSVLTLPVAEYDHSLGCSVVGGFVYRGAAFSVLQGVYLFGDYCSGRIWGLAPDGTGGWQMAELLDSDLQLSSFGEDEAGELYVLDMKEGRLYRIVAR